VRDFLPLRDGSILFVLHHQGEIRWLPDSLSSIRMPTRIIVGARERSDGLVELFDRTHRELVRIHVPPRPRVVESQRILVDKEVWDARWVDDGWLILAGDSAALPSVYSVSDRGQVSRLGPPVAGLQSRLVRLGSMGGKALVPELNPPFRVFALEADEWRLVSPLDSYSLPHGSVALDILDLGSLALQTLVDQTTRRRIFRLFSLESRAGRARLVETPLSLTLHDAGHIWGVRSVEREEVVQYSWRWR
jgi:hypothetical protein